MSEIEPRGFPELILPNRPDNLKVQPFRSLDELHGYSAWTLLFRDRYGMRQRIRKLFEESDTLLIKDVDQLTSPSCFVELIPFGHYEDDEKLKSKSVQIGRLLSSIGLPDETIVDLANQFSEFTPRVGEHGLAQKLANTLDRRVVGTNGDNIHQKLVYYPKAR